MRNKFNEEDAAADVAIVGLGPGGLSAALEIAHQGKEVLVFTNREHYIRGQRLILTRETEQFLLKHFDHQNPLDVTFWKKYGLEKTLQTKDIEKYLYRKLSKLPNVTIVKVPKNSDHAIQKITQGAEGNADCLVLNNNEKYYFHNLLGADGAWHSTANLVADCFKQPIEYELATSQERHPYHAVVQLKLKSNVNPNKKQFQTDVINEMQFLASQGWQESYSPKYYIFTNAACTKFYFAGEIPQQIFAASKPEQTELLKKWASSFIKKHYGFDEEHLEYRESKNTPAKDKLQTTVFSMTIEVCKTAVLNLSNGVFAQIGDARRPPNYNLAHGVNDAIIGGLLFAKAMSSTPFAEESFKKSLKDMDDEIENKMQEIKLTRKDAKEKAKKKLIDAIDNLLLLLQSNSENTPLSISKLELAKQTFETTGQLAVMYDALNEMKSIIENAQNVSIFYWAYTLINCCANSEAHLKTTGFKEVINTLESFLQEKQPSSL
ncbi:FAD-dependent oxidoreductase [Legionella jamestowniensis]|uniref:Dihydropyrimidine dehydrogenase subunit A n=1 Tax=Legionella jamestowniensis TaxID=455 RepID=A0A0W0UK61_9GAMM|nr:FAD-dependent oxidoreductase [Legionella jamestowniensis]KTD08260.1 dihydropyrimidine dehydrogenase subunit A [Legionella jamestowniensis]SFL97732.1 Pyridine nucleotide-disulphide oxidoreductase [Legionella jamestowniensis DSM 19215]